MPVTTFLAMSPGMNEKITHPKWLRMAYRSLGMGGMQRDVGEEDGGKRLGFEKIGLIGSIYI